MRERIRPASARRPLQRLCCLAVVLALAACGSPAVRPSHVPVDELRVVAGPSPGLAHDRTVAGKGPTAAVGALAGGASAGLVATLACLPTGFLFAACLATVVPSSIAVGAIGGGVTGAVLADDEQTTLAKRQLVAEQLDATQPSAALAATLRRALGAWPGRADDAAHWRVEVEVVHLIAEAGALDKPFKLSLISALTLTGPAPAAPSTTRRYVSSSAMAETIDGWRADDGRPLRQALQAMVDDAGARMAKDLKR